MKALSFNTVEIELTKTELASYFERFGHRYWNDVENIIFIPISEFINDNQHLGGKFYSFFSCVGKSADGIYINCGKCK